MGVSLDGSTPKSSILIGFSITNHEFWDTPIFGNTSYKTTTDFFIAHKRVNLRLLTGAAQPPREDVRRKVSIIGHDLSFDKNVLLGKLSHRTIG